MSVALLFVALLGCRHQSSRAQVPAVGSDSIQGIVKLTGLSAMPDVELTADDGRSIRLVSKESLASVAGLRIVARGVRATRSFQVAGFRVVAAQGVPAVDGILAMRDTGLVLKTPDDRTLTVSRPTGGLRALVGRRVWIAGPLDRVAVSYGVID